MRNKKVLIADFTKNSGLNRILLIKKLRSIVNFTFARQISAKSLQCFFTQMLDSPPEVFTTEFAVWNKKTECKKTSIYSLLNSKLLKQTGNSAWINEFLCLLTIHISKRLC